MPDTMVKICGVRRLADALVAADAGADYVGMVFVPGRRRRLDPSAAREITDGLRALGPNAPRSVGLFGDQPLADVLSVVEAAALDYAQLCGDESVAYCHQIMECAGVIKVLHVPDGGRTAVVDSVKSAMDSYHAAGCAITLDSHVAGLHGGTGQSFDWEIAGDLAAEGRRFLLAGGLTPENVVEAIARANPWGVDVSSGVETDGAQDPHKIRNFVANARLGGQPVEVS